jgi:hypothetical protein
VVCDNDSVSLRDHFLRELSTVWIKCVLRFKEWLRLRLWIAGKGTYSVGPIVLAAEVCKKQVFFFQQRALNFMGR